MLTAGDSVDEIALFVEDLNLEIAEDMAVSLVVGDGSVLWTRQPMEGVVALPAIRPEPVRTERSAEREGTPPP